MKYIYFITYRTNEIRDSKRKLLNNFFSDVTIFNNMSLNVIGFKDNKEFKTKENIVYFEPLKDDFDYSKSSFSSLDVITNCLFLSFLLHVVSINLFVLVLFISIVPSLACSSIFVIL